MLFECFIEDIKGDVIYIRGEEIDLHQQIVFQLSLNNDIKNEDKPLIFIGNILWWKLTKNESLITFRTMRKGNLNEKKI